MLTWVADRYNCPSKPSHSEIGRYISYPIIISYSTYTFVPTNNPTSFLLRRKEKDPTTQFVRKKTFYGYSMKTHDVQ